MPLTRVVLGEDFFECLRLSMVEVGSRPRHAAQGRRVELVLMITWDAGADVMGQLVIEGSAAVAVAALALAFEDRAAAGNAGGIWVLLGQRTWKRQRFQIRHHVGHLRPPRFVTVQSPQRAADTIGKRRTGAEPAVRCRLLDS